MKIEIEIRKNKEMHEKAKGCKNIIELKNIIKDEKTTTFLTTDALIAEAFTSQSTSKIVGLYEEIDFSKIDKIILFDINEKIGKEAFWHSSSHLLAQAVKKLYPDAKLGMGPAIDEGFYYDFEVDKTFSPEDLEKIEKEMKSLAKRGFAIIRTELSYDEALKELTGREENLKLEILGDIKAKEKDSKKISFYKQGDFMDICKGPHLSNTKAIKGIKLMRASGAYWKGDSKNKQLQRIYGISFPTKEELDAFMSLREEALKRDHRKLGKELDLFSFHDEAPGMAFWHPKGIELKNILTDFWRKEHKKEGYTEISTPIILNRKLWETSGHWFNYKENMYALKIDDGDVAIKPMNCPGGMLYYKEKSHSYKEFPMRVGEIGLVHRHELSGVLSGLFRVRCFNQDDAHIFMTPDQIESEIVKLIGFVDRVYKLFGFTYHVELSTRPAKSIGTDEQWKLATEGLKKGIEAAKLPYKINEGDGAFYGPKIDFHIKDAIGRTWQCGTIQLDMNLPERFDLTYMGEDGNNVHRPVMLHRVIYGSFERFIGILIEHYAGKFPMWLSPVQLRILSVADRHSDYAEEIEKELSNAGIRIEVDKRTESIGKKVREAQLAQVNYIAVVGDTEVKEKTITIRTRDNEVIGSFKVKDFLKKMQEEVKNKV